MAKFTCFTRFDLSRFKPPRSKNSNHDNNTKEDGWNLLVPCSKKNKLIIPHASGINSQASLGAISDAELGCSNPFPHRPPQFKRSELTRKKRHANSVTCLLFFPDLFVRSCAKMGNVLQTFSNHVRRTNNDAHCCVCPMICWAHNPEGGDGETKSVS